MKYTQLIPEGEKSYKEVKEVSDEAGVPTGILAGRVKNIEK